MMANGSPGARRRRTHEGWLDGRSGRPLADPDDADYVRGHREGEVMRHYPEAERLLPRWTAIRLAPHGAFSRDTDGGGWLKDETGRPISVPGLVIEATNPQGRRIGSGAFETVGEAVADLRRWEDVG